MSDNVAQLKQETQNPDWPMPAGWRILVDPAKPKSVSDGGIIFAEETQVAQEHMNYVGRVVAMGPLCYKHSKFEGGAPWCKVGDWIAYGQYSGQTVTVKNQQAIDALALMHAEAREMGVAMEALRKRARIESGASGHSQVVADLAGLEAEINELGCAIVDADDNREHRLRLLNDDEVLATIPRTEAIKIYF